MKWPRRKPALDDAPSDEAEVARHGLSRSVASLEETLARARMHWPDAAAEQRALALIEQRLAELR